MKKTNKTNKTNKTTKKATNEALEKQLATIKQTIKKAREASQEYTANMIYAFLLDVQEYKKTESAIRSMVADSFGDDWQAVRGSENRKIRYARIIFESRLEALKNCKNPADVLHYLKTNQEQLSHAKVLNINTNQDKGNPNQDKGNPNQDKGNPNQDKGNPNPNTESGTLEVVAFIKSAVKNPKLLAILNDKLAESGIRIQYLPKQAKKAA